MFESASSIISALPAEHVRYVAMSIQSAGLTSVKGHALPGRPGARQALMPQGPVLLAASPGGDSFCHSALPLGRRAFGPDLFAGFSS